MTSDRQQAIDALLAARDALIVEISDKINEESKEDFVGSFVDAFSNSVNETLELGDRLVKLGYLIAHMQAETMNGQGQQQTMTAKQMSKIEPATAAGEFKETDVCQMTVGHHPTWGNYVQLVNSRNLNGSAVELSQLLDIDVQLAMRCTAHFAARLSDNHDETIGQLNSLTAQLHVSTPTGTLNLLRHLFNLHGDTAVAIFTRLRTT